tara:strand:+ start:387 stop:629 length:243 start_codon:yes stop_codon:yes gene_type:complete
MNKRTKEQIEIEIKEFRRRRTFIVRHIKEMRQSIDAQVANLKYCETEIKLLEGELNPIDNPLQDINACARMLGIGSRGCS